MQAKNPFRDWWGTENPFITQKPKNLENEFEIPNQGLGVVAEIPKFPNLSMPLATSAVTNNFKQATLPENFQTPKKLMGELV